MWIFRILLQFYSKILKIQIFASFLDWYEQFGILLCHKNVNDPVEWIFGLSEHFQALYGFKTH